MEVYVYIYIYIYIYICAIHAGGRFSGGSQWGVRSLRTEPKRLKVRLLLLIVQSYALGQFLITSVVQSYALGPKTRLPDEALFKEFQGNI